MDKTNTLVIPKPEQKAIEIGDTKQPIFYPQTKLTYWDNECNFSARLKDIEYEKGLVQEVGDVIEWSKDNRIARFYEKTNNEFEFEVELASKPISNVLEFTIQSKEFNFFYQPPLNQDPDALNDPLVVSTTETQAFDKDGNAILNRPENVVGSYAVYHKTKKHNKVGGKAYRTGKAFHIYRPYVEDSSGWREWCDLNITEGLMTITIPQNFLDNAVYPIIVDPTFGDTTYGVSNGTRAANSLFGISPASNPTENGTVTSIHLSIDGNGSSGINTKGVLMDYVVDNSTIVTNGVTSGTAMQATASGVYLDITYSSSPSIVSGSPYLISCVNDGTTRYFYDGTTAAGIFDDSNSYATPQDTGPDTGTTRDMSFYITYTASGGGSAIKTVNGLAVASVKTVNGLAIASVKTINGLA